MPSITSPRPRVTTLTVAVHPQLIDRADPTGDQRRAGTFDARRVPVTADPDQWTWQTPTVGYRLDIARQRLYRRTLDMHAWAGYRDLWVSVHSRIAREWLALPMWWLG